MKRKIENGGSEVHQCKSLMLLLFGEFFHLIDCLCVICFVITDYYNIQCGGQHERAVLRSAREIAQVHLYYT